MNPLIFMGKKALRWKVIDFELLPDMYFPLSVSFICEVFLFRIKVLYWQFVMHFTTRNIKFLKLRGSWINQRINKRVRQLPIEFRSKIIYGNIRLSRWFLSTIFT